MLSLFRILVDIPSLDRFVDYLTSLDQGQIDPLTKQIQDLTARLQQARAKLETVEAATVGANKGQ